MKTIKDYKDMITAEFMANEDTQKRYGFGENETFDNRFSTVSIESILFYVFAFGMWVIAMLFDKHRADVQSELETLKPHNLFWYANKAKAYQHNIELPKNEYGEVIADVYTTSNEIAKIVKYAVARETRNNSIIVKVAKHTSDTDRTPQRLSIDELSGLRRYFSQIKDAGVPISVISNDADSMEVNVTIYYNPILLLLNDGVLRDSSGSNVVRDAIEQVVENLPFNGDCRISDILEAIKNISGVDVADITVVNVWNGNGEREEVIGFCTPESGYFKLENLNITAKPYNNGNEI
jgi:hypothetical protein